MRLIAIFKTFSETKDSSRTWPFHLSSSSQPISGRNSQIVCRKLFHWSLFPCHRSHITWVDRWYKYAFPLWKAHHFYQGHIGPKCLGPCPLELARSETWSVYHVLPIIQQPFICHSIKVYESCWQNLVVLWQWWYHVLTLVPYLSCRSR